MERGGGRREGREERGKRGREERGERGREEIREREREERRERGREGREVDWLRFERDCTCKHTHTLCIFHCT